MDEHKTELAFLKCKRGDLKVPVNTVVILVHFRVAKVTDFPVECHYYFGFFLHKNLFNIR
jgi:hypothetical protein